MIPEDDDTFAEIVRNADLDARLARLSARSDGSRSAPRTGPPARGGRRSAARGSRRTALGLSAVTTLGLAGWMYSASGTTATDLASIGSTTDPPTTAAATTATSRAPGTTASTVASSSATTSTTRASTTVTMKDGTYTGVSSTTRWGPVQVQITVAGGRISAVDVPSYPRNDNKSASINARAVPTLVRSTLTAQSASVSNVSGATYTSMSYRTSLQSAIDAARKAS